MRYKGPILVLEGALVEMCSILSAFISDYLIGIGGHDCGFEKVAKPRYCDVFHPILYLKAALETASLNLKEGSPADIPSAVYYI